MKIKSLGNPYDGDTDLRHSPQCQCQSCGSSKAKIQAASTSVGSAQSLSESGYSDSEAATSEAALERLIESCVVRSMFGHNEISRRSFAKLVGGSTLAAAVASVFPMEAAKAAVLESIGKPEKTKLNVGFVPITCATPMIMAKSV